MNVIDEYFKKYTDDLLFLELKDKNIYKELESLPLAIYSKDFSKQVIRGDMANSIKFETIIEGMLITIASDSDFPYRDKYIEVLEKHIKNIASYTATKAMDYEKESPEKSLLLLRAGYIINPFDKYNSYNYARRLWPLAYEVEEKKKGEFIKTSIDILQQIISMDEDFPLSYYELGNLYRNLGEYVKSRSYYNKALQKVDNEIAKQEIREKLMEIEQNAQIEEAVYYIGKSDYNSAIKLLTKILSEEKRADAYYYLAVCYQNISEYDKSIEAFKNAIKQKGEFKEIYNDMAISYYLNKKPLEAIEVINIGLEKYPEDPKLIYNRLQINLSIGNIDKAKEDIDNLLSYDDLSDEIFNNLMIIKEQYML
ncbi:MAG: tetratricopeptide repeat protein [Tissierellia bacterium]|nr:tetratricopeptide repeat protein [Tissierellia bacterium]